MAESIFWALLAPVRFWVDLGLDGCRKGMEQSLPPGRHSVHASGKHACGEIGGVGVGVKQVLTVSDSIHVRFSEFLNKHRDRKWTVMTRVREWEES